MQIQYGTKVRHLLVFVSLASLLSACASGPPSYEQNIQSAISGSGNVMVRYLDDDVVLLSGWVEDHYSRNAVMRAAWKNKNVREVINRIDISPRNRF